MFSVVRTTSLTNQNRSRRVTDARSGSTSVWEGQRAVRQGIVGGGGGVGEIGGQSGKLQVTTVAMHAGGLGGDFVLVSFSVKGHAGSAPGLHNTR